MYGSMAQHLMLKADFFSPFQLTSAAGSLAPTLDRQMTSEPCHEQSAIVIFALLCVIARYLCACHIFVSEQQQVGICRTIGLRFTMQLAMDTWLLQGY